MGAVVSENSPDPDAPPSRLPVYAVCGATLAWVLCFVASFVLPDLLTRPGSSGWEGLGIFVLWQLIAAGVAAAGAVLAIVLLLMKRVGRWIGVLGLVPGIVTLCGLAWLTLFAA